MEGRVRVGTPVVLVERGSTLIVLSESSVSVHDMKDVDSDSCEKSVSESVSEYQLSVLHGVLIMLSVLKVVVLDEAARFASSDTEIEAVERADFSAIADVSVIVSSR